MLLEIPKRLGSFSSSVTSGSDSDDAEEEQGEKRAAIVHPLDFRPGCGLEREWLLHPSSSWGWPLQILPLPLSPVLAGVYANRFLVRLEVVTIPSFRYGRRCKCMQRSYSRKKKKKQMSDLGGLQKQAQGGFKRKMQVGATYTAPFCSQRSPL